MRLKNIKKGIFSKPKNLEKTRSKYPGLNPKNPVLAKPEPAKPETRKFEPVPALYSFSYYEEINAYIIPLFNRRIF